MTRRPRSRGGERGFTLVELLVSMALLAIIGTVMGVVFSVGMRAILAPGASHDRLDAASNTITVEQFLTEDVDRATCIYVPSQPPTSPWHGGCSNMQTGGSCLASSLCLGWPDLATTPDQCDVAIYDFSSSPSQVTRTELLGQEQGLVTTIDQVSVTATFSTSGWPPLDLKLTATDAQLANPPTVRLQLQPFASQPWPISGLTTDSPC
jgi:prepilin-type N-terminal cleavage/methylation domain-containing protein